MRSRDHRLAIGLKGGELVEDAEELVVVDRIRELRGEGKSLRQIAEVLTGRGCVRNGPSGGIRTR
jgi:hypothetical protein